MSNLCREDPTFYLSCFAIRFDFDLFGSCRYCLERKFVFSNTFFGCISRSCSFSYSFSGGSGGNAGSQPNISLGGTIGSSGAGGGGFLLFYAEDRNKLRHAMKKVGLEEVRFKFDYEGTKVILS